jgi:D-alanyl-D-alanine dipeptidase
MKTIPISRLFLVLLIVAVCIATPVEQASLQSATPVKLSLKPAPAPAPARWRALIGEYGPDEDVLLILEKDGRLGAAFKRQGFQSLAEVTPSLFRFREDGPNAGKRLVFTRQGNRRASQIRFEGVTYKRRPLGPEEGATQLSVEPLRPVPELIREALAQQPPTEVGTFLPSNLIELKKLDPSIKLDIRYATTNNLFGTVFYSEPRAFLQRPAAEALVRIHRRLKKLGYGLLVHDAYRPWYVTKVFWDATPEEKKLFVADPAKGSRHNRGAAVDLTLYSLKTGKPVEMVGTYDETTGRSYPDYPGGTSLQRWHRDLLRAAMEADGFTVYEAEWWHFDFDDWQKYPIGNQVFDQIGVKGR